MTTEGYYMYPYLFGSFMSYVIFFSVDPFKLAAALPP